ncbi:MAG: disulfide bond formation protein DsbA [Nitrospinaceae bacterium]
MRYATALMIACLLWIPAAGLAGEAFTVKGKYELVGKLERLKGAKQIEMVEFFNYSCGHCYKFLETSKRLHKKFKGKLLHKKSPIYWGQQNPYPAMAFYISDEQGVEQKFTQELFDTNFQLNINIFQPRVIKLLARDYGIEKEMTEGMQSSSIKAKVQKSLALWDH